MRDGHASVLIKNRAISGALRHSGNTLLTYRIEYPVFISTKFRGCLCRLNSFYRDGALEYKRYCETELFGQAVEQYGYSVKNGYPVRGFDVVQAVTAAYSRDCAVSLYTDRYEYTGGAHGSTIRRSQSWQLQDCRLIKLKELAPCEPDYKTYILSEAEKQIKTEPELYFEDYAALIAETFNPDSFYCTPEGVVIYYQQYDIAPYAGGIREFLIPYGGCVINPAELC